MHARMITTYFAPANADQVIRLWKEVALPSAKTQWGFHGGRLLVDRELGRAVSVFLWETEEDALATGEGSAHLKTVFHEFANIFTKPSVIEYYEVAGEA